METQKLDIEKKRKAAQKLDILEKRKKNFGTENFSSIKSFNICISVRIGFPIVQREPLKELQDEIFGLRFIRHFAPSLNNKNFLLKYFPLSL